VLLDCPILPPSLPLLSLFLLGKAIDEHLELLAVHGLGGVGCVLIGCMHGCI